jgi:hypothetical protein
VEIPSRPRAGGGHFSITLHDPSCWRDSEQQPPLPWLPVTMIFDLPHLQAALMMAPGADLRQGLFMLDTGVTPEILLGLQCGDMYTFLRGGPHR